MRGSYKEALRDPRARRPLKGRRRIRLHVEAAELEPRLLLSGAGSLDSTFASAGVFSNEFCRNILRAMWMKEPTPSRWRTTARLRCQDM